MKVTFIFVILFYCVLFADAQVKVFKVQTNEIQFPINAFRSATNILVAHGINFSADFGMAVIDTNGSIINNIVYGSQVQMEEPIQARQHSNGKIIISGLNFWDSPAHQNIGNYKGFVMIVDTFGQFERSFHVKSISTYLGKVTNSIFLKGHYYFSGMNVDSSEIGPPIERLFVCKTDTFGNTIWFKTYPQYNTAIAANNTALEYTYNEQNILVGTGMIDSIVANQYYYSYLIMKLDTAGNFVSRIDIPKFVSGANLPGFKSTTQIVQTFNNKYLICNGSQFNELNVNLDLIDSTDLAQNIYRASFSRNCLFDQSHIICGNMAFGKVYNNNEVFARDFSSIPSIVSIKDIIPTYDGGYFALILQLNGQSTYIKMDCDGNYDNAINSCWPVLTKQVELNETYIYYANEMISVNNFSTDNMDVALFDVSGKSILKKVLPSGLNYMNVLNLPRGIYIMQTRQLNKLYNTLKFIK